MSQDNAGNCQQPFEGDNANDAPTAELDKVKEENKALKEKLREAEQKMQMAKNEVRNTGRPKIQNFQEKGEKYKAQKT
jgi:hypothetical protein